MLAATQKVPLRTWKSFFTTCARKHGKYVSLFYVPAASGSFSVIVSKKKVRTAVQRNAVKRNLYRYYRQAGWLSKNTSTAVVAVVQRSRPVNQLFQELEQHLAEIL